MEKSTVCRSRAPLRVSYMRISCREGYTHIYISIYLYIYIYADRDVQGYAGFRDWKVRL